MSQLTGWINVALLDDEPLARQRLRRLVENWSWEVSCPSDVNGTLPTLWAWLLARAERDEFDQMLASLPPDDDQRPITTTRRLVRPEWGQDESAEQQNSHPASILVKARLVLEAKDPQDFDQRAAERVDARPLDVILADVRLPGDENGVAFAARWQGGSQSPVVVMISAFEDSAADAFTIDAADYVIKPVRAERLAAALCKALSKKASRESAHASWGRPMVQAAQRGLGDETVITVMERGKKMMNVLVDDIVMFRSELKYTTIHTRHRQYLSETSVSKFAQQYGHRFLKVHRGCLIAWSHVDGLIHERRKNGNGPIKGRVWYLKMKGMDERVEISRRLWSEVAQRFKINPFIAYRQEYVKIDPEGQSAPDLLPPSSAGDALETDLDDETFFRQEEHFVQTQKERPPAATMERPLPSDTEPGVVPPTTD